MAILYFAGSKRVKDKPRQSNARYDPYGQPVTYTDSQRVSAAKRRETVRNGCESARISCEIRCETSLNFAKFTQTLRNLGEFCERVRKSAKECMVREVCESICRLANWAKRPRNAAKRPRNARETPAKRPRNARETPRNSGESYETGVNLL